jgi:hypothetical protein
LKTAFTKFISKVEESFFLFIVLFWCSKPFS